MLSAVKNGKKEGNSAPKSKVRNRKPAVSNMQYKAMQKLVCFASEEKLREGSTASSTNLNQAAFKFFHGAEKDDDDIGVAGSALSFFGRFSKLKVTDAESNAEVFHSIFKGKK